MGVDDGLNVGCGVGLNVGGAKGNAVGIFVGETVGIKYGADVASSHSVLTFLTSLYNTPSLLRGKVIVFKVAVFGNMGTPIMLSLFSFVGEKDLLGILVGVKEGIFVGMFVGLDVGVDVVGDGVGRSEGEDVGSSGQQAIQRFFFSLQKVSSSVIKQRVKSLAQ